MQNIHNSFFLSLIIESDIRHINYQKHQGDRIWTYALCTKTDALTRLRYTSSHPPEFDHRIDEYLNRTRPSFLDTRKREPIWVINHAFIKFASNPSLLEFQNPANSRLQVLWTIRLKSHMLGELLGNSLIVILPGSKGVTLLFCRSSHSLSFHLSIPLHELVQSMP